MCHRSPGFGRWLIIARLLLDIGCGWCWGYMLCFPCSWRRRRNHKAIMRIYLYSKGGYVLTKTVECVTLCIVAGKPAVVSTNCIPLIAVHCQESCGFLYSALNLGFVLNPLARLIAWRIHSLVRLAGSSSNKRDFICWHYAPDEEHPSRQQESKLILI